MYLVYFQQPQVPLYPFHCGADGWTLSQSGSSSTNKNKLDSRNNKRLNHQNPSEKAKNSGKLNNTSSTAFHRDSINVIAKFNERRCNGMPLYGQDLIEVLTIVTADAICAPPKVGANSNRWKGSSFILPPSHASSLANLNLPPKLAVNFWPFFGAKSNRNQRINVRQLRTRWLKSVAKMEDLTSVELNVNSDLILPPKVSLVAGFNRTHLALTSKHLAVEEAIKFAREKQKNPLRMPLRRQFQIAAENKSLREVSSKLEKLDSLLKKFRKQGERALVFCQMPEMLALLAKFLRSHKVSFAYLDPHANVKQRLTVLEDFSSRHTISALLTSPQAASFQQPNLPVKRFNGFTDICNVVFFDSTNLIDGNLDQTAETLEWCKSFNNISNLRVYKLVAEDTVEDSLSIKALLQQQQKTEDNHHSGVSLMNNGPIWKIKKHALEALFNPHFGDNGVLGKNSDTNKDTNVSDFLLFFFSNFVAFIIFVQL